MNKTPVKIFIYHAPEDQPMCQQLEEHLSPMMTSGQVELWHKGKILPGQKRLEPTQAAFDEADIILLLVSSAFFSNSDCCKKMEEAMLKHKGEKAGLIPVMLRPCDWENTDIGILHPLPEGGVPITNNQWDSRDTAWMQVIEGLKKVWTNDKTSIKPLQEKTPVSPQKAARAAIAFREQIRKYLSFSNTEHAIFIQMAETKMWLFRKPQAREFRRELSALYYLEHGLHLPKNLMKDLLKYRSFVNKFMDDKKGEVFALDEPKVMKVAVRPMTERIVQALKAVGKLAD